jgi:hypothetical protein
MQQSNTNTNTTVAGLDLTNIENFTQSQAHGLFWDNEIRVKVFHLGQCKNDTKKYDIDASENRFDLEENVSIKTSSNNNIDCGDICRFYNGSFSQKYTIILIRYSQKGAFKHIKEIIEINYCQELRDYLFGTISEEELKEYASIIKAIPKGLVADEIKTAYKTRKNELQNFHNMKINISPKVDSGSQRRVQCSIPKVEQLLDRFPEFVISRTSNVVIRGENISAQIQSAARTRK